ncbi:helix-turn-helix domain-containing protein [Cardiobacteriaceae bacterium TAE3-ERU3]|nr:helix-turn-helix domain-containing protein [Cardiobacteriaceae bacterium TAE3-ERU3]
MNNAKDAAQAALLDIFVTAETPVQVQALLTAFLTDSEQHELTNRLRIFTLLAQDYTQREIAEQLGVGIATVSRGARAYQQHSIAELLPHLQHINLEKHLDKDKS